MWMCVDVCVSVWTNWDRSSNARQVEHKMCLRSALRTRDKWAKRKEKQVVRSKWVWEEKNERTKQRTSKWVALLSRVLVRLIVLLSHVNVFLNKTSHQNTSDSLVQSFHTFNAYQLLFPSFFFLFCVFAGLAVDEDATRKLLCWTHTLTHSHTQRETSNRLIDTERPLVTKRVE